MNRWSRWGLVVAVALAVIYWKTGDKTHPAETPPSSVPLVQDPTRPAHPGIRGATRPRDDVPPPIASTSFGKANPTIERLVVDKLEVCPGEENFVHVDARTADQTDPDLRIALAGTGFIGSDSTGPRMPFRLLSALTPEQMPSVTISGWGGTHVEQQIPFVKVRDCQAEPFLTIVTHKLSDQAPDTYAFEVMPVDGTTLAELTWDFGDAQTLTTHEAKATHSYGARPQLTRFSELLIGVKATDDSGRHLSGSRTLELFNRDYWTRRTGS